MITRIDEAGRILQGNHNLARISTDEGSLEQLNNSINTIYENFKRHVDVPNVLTYDEYNEYIVPLYNREAVDAMSPEEKHQYSDRLSARIIDTKPIYIVDNYDKNKILLTLPALRNRLEHIDNSTTDVCATYAHVMHLDSNNRIVVRDQQIQCMRLADEFGKAQDVLQLREAIGETDALAREVHIKVHGVDIYNQDGSVRTKDNDDSKSSSPSVDLFGGFEIVED